MSTGAQQPSLPVPTTKPMAVCRHCLFEIPLGASICTECKQYQSRWHNMLSKASTVAAAVSVVGAAATYIATTLPEVRKMVAWEENVAVLQFTTRKGLSVANLGDGVVHLSHLDLRATYPSGKQLFTRTIQIDKDLERGKFYFVKGEDELFGAGRLTIAKHDSNDDFIKSLEDAGDMIKVLAGDKCNLLVVYKADSPLLAMYKKSMGEKLFTYPVEAEVTYYSFGMKKSLSQSFGVVGVLQKSAHENCISKQTVQ